MLRRSSILGLGGVLLGSLLGACSSGGSGGGGGGGATGGSPDVAVGQPGCMPTAECVACAGCMNQCLCETQNQALCESACGGAGGAGGMASDGGTTPEPGAIGAACTDDAECGTAVGAECLATWPDGHCTIRGCGEGTCPTGSDCFKTTGDSTICLKTCTQKSDCPAKYACHAAGACVPACQSAADCSGTMVCNSQTGQCEDAPCTTGSCSAGLQCDASSGKCVPDLHAGPPPGPGPTCLDLPPRDCVGTDCAAVSAFEPKQGPGWDDYPLNGETIANQYRSYARKDMQMLVQWATAYVHCKAKDWNTGIGGALGLGDMSEANGAIPGTSIGQPGHPAGTHVNGFDMDIAYYQVGTVNNYLRAVCEHKIGGQDQYRCVSSPHILDLWRTTLFLGALFTSDTVRVIGVDGQIGPLVEAAMPSLCATGWLPQVSCNIVKSKLAYETTNTGKGWYNFHHHHLHLSLNGKPGGGAPLFMPPSQASNLGPLLDGARSVEAGRATGPAGCMHQDFVRPLGYPVPGPS